ncbi:MAG: amidohydrolase, partial [Cyanobacteria bacterium]|nr:amidohydrolase [Cyanobacteriota bacterium]
DDVEAVVGLHVFPDLPTGHIALREGPFLAACAKFDIEIHGQGCHGAFPQEGVDAIVLASQVVQAIQSIVSRRISALDPAVVTIGGIKSKTYRANIVCELVEMLGTARYFREETADQIHAELEKCCRIAESMGGSYTLDFRKESPALVNNGRIVDTVSDVTTKLLGAGTVHEAPMEMGAEDFSFVSEKYPSCFFALGARMETPRKLHTATFDIDESAIPIGAAILAASALRLCSE